MNIKPCTVLPYNQTSVRQVYEDFKGMLHTHAIQNTIATHGQVSRDDGMSTAHDVFLMVLGSFDSTENPKGNTRAGFGSYLSKTLRATFMNERRAFKRRMARVIPEYYLKSTNFGGVNFQGTTIADTSLANSKLANGDYGKHAKDIVTKMTLETVLEHTYDWTDQEDAVMRMYYGLDTGESATLRECGENMGVSHEWVSLKRKSAIEKIQFALNRDIRQYNRK